EQPLGFFGSGVNPAALREVGIFIASQLQQALNVGGAFDFGGGSLQNLDGAGKIFFAAGFVGALHVIGLELLGLFLLGAFTHDGQQRPQAAIAGDFLRSALESGQRVGGLSGIEQLAGRSHLLFDEFLLLAAFALLLSQRFQLEQARIAGEAGESLLDFFAGGLIGI